MKNFLSSIQLKEWTALLALIFGLGITLAGFIVSPLGIIDDSVLWVLGQILIYVGSIFGISTHYQKKQMELEDKIAKKLDEKNNNKQGKLV